MNNRQKGDGKSSSEQNELLLPPISLSVSLALLFFLFTLELLGIQSGCIRLYQALAAVTFILCALFTLASLSPRFDKGLQRVLHVRPKSKAWLSFWIIATMLVVSLSLMAFLIGFLDQWLDGVSTIPSVLRPVALIVGFLLLVDILFVGIRDLCRVIKKDDIKKLPCCGTLSHNFLSWLHVRVRWVTGRRGLLWRLTRRLRLEDYLVLLLLAGLGVCIWEAHRGTLSLVKTDDRTLVAALAGVLGTVFSVLLTVTLVAIQLAVQSYTPRVAHLHTKSVYFITLVASYIGSIVWLFVMLGLNPWIAGGSHLAFWANTGVLIGLFNITYLIPFVIHTARLLRPENIVGALLQDIELRHFFVGMAEDGQFPSPLPYVTVKSTDADYAPRAIGAQITTDVREEQYRGLEDTLLAIEDLTVKAIRAGERVSVRRYLDLVIDRYAELVEGELDQVQADRIVTCFADFLRRIAEHSLAVRDLQIAGDVIEHYRELRGPAAVLGLHGSIFYLSKVIDSIRIRAIDMSEKGISTLDIGRIDSICSTFFAEAAASVS